jgi:hypothetical protein
VFVKAARIAAAAVLGKGCWVVFGYKIASFCRFGFFCYFFGYFMWFCGILCF